MAPFEALYGRKCRTQLMWSEVGERTFFGLVTIVEAEENVVKVRENLKIAQSRQKSYADPKRKAVSLDVGEYVYLRVSPLRGTKRFHVKEKLSPRYVGPYPIVQRIGNVAYKLELPTELVGVHLVFHVSQLRKCVLVEKTVPVHTRHTRHPGVPGVHGPDPGLGGEVKQEDHHALLQGALE
jgi:hypothetical protein